MAGGVLSLTRYSTGAYLLDANVRSVIARLPNTGTVELEGFNENHDSITEQMLVYELAQERAHGRVSLAADLDDSSSLDYVGKYPLSGAQFDPNYKWVLTRMPGMATGRKTLASRGGIALEARATPADVIADAGFLVAPPTNESGGYAYVDPYVDEPLRVIVSGESGDAYALISIKEVATPTRAVGATIVRRSGRELVACVPTVKDGPSRVAQLRFRPSTYLQVTGLFASSSCTSRP